MVALVILWSASLLLCVAGGLALVALIAARGVARPAGRKRSAARRKLAPLLMGGDAARRHLGRVEGEVAMELTIELAELTRGSDRDAMLRAAANLDVPRLLSRRLRSGNAQDRLTAAETLAHFPEHAHEAVRALDDGNADVRLGAALALAHREDGPPPAEIVGKLRVGSEEHSLLLISLMRDLAERDPLAIEAMIFDDSTAEEAKLAAIDALAGLGHAHAPLLAYVAQEAWSKPSRHARALRALGRTAHPAARAAISDGLDSEHTVVRAAAAQAAGSARMPEFAAALGALLGDPDWRVRFNAGQALLKLGRDGAGTMSEIAATSDPVASEAARVMLAEAGQG